jgi:hypothetical protein
MMHLAALALLPLVHATVPPAPVGEGVLGVVPEEAFALFHAADLAALQERALQNEWVELRGSKAPDPLLIEVDSMLQDGMQLRPEAIWGVASKLRGETVLYLTPDGAALFTSAPEPRDEARTAFRELLSSASSGPGRRVQTQVGAASVEVGVTQGAWDPRAQSHGKRHLALVDHPLGLGLFTARSGEALEAAVAGAIGGLESGRRAPLVTRFLAARAGVPRTGGVELFVDGATLAGSFAGDLADLLGEDEVPVRDLLGLDETSWLHASFDLFPGRRVDCRGVLHLPEGSFAARLADTFSALPADLASRLPSDLSALWSLQWDTLAFYRALHSGIEEALGEESAARLEAGRAAAGAMLGADPVEGLLAEMDGTFSVFVREVEGDRTLDGLGFLVGVREGLRFQESLEALVDVAFADELELDDVDGVDVYRGKGGRPEGDTGGGLAFPPREFIAALRGKTLDRHLRALGGDLEASAAQERVGQILTDERGSFLTFATELGWLRRSRNASLFGAGGIPRGSEPDSSPLDRAWLIGTAERTRAGVEFELEIR